MPRRIYSEDYWFSKYGLYGQPCHRGFTVHEDYLFSKYSLYGQPCHGGFTA